MIMFCFKNKKKLIQESAEDNRVEIVTQKNATRKVVEQAKIANQQLKELLEHNGFTIRIFLAAGGSTKRKKDRVS